MKHTMALSLSLLICLTFFQLECLKKPSSQANLSPANWSEAELEKYHKLNKIFDQPHPLGEGSKGMVVGAQAALAVRAGLEALKQGGTAVDAAIATALTQVVLSAGSGVTYAGVIDMVYYEAATGEVYSMNADWNTVQEEKDPLSIPFMGTPSGRTALVPGFMAGVQAAHNRFGKLPFATLFEPAIYFAENGFEVTSKLARLIDLRKDVLTRLPETRKIFTKKNGDLYKEGDLFKQPQLAETLRKVATQGADYMYKGEWAKKFVDAVSKEGGKMTLKDMEDYQVIWSEPLQTTYRDYEVFAPGFPSLGAVNTIEALNLLERADLPRYGHYTTSPESLYWFIQINNIASLLPNLPLKIIKKYLPEGDFSLQSRVKKETARLVWKKMQEPEWVLMKQEVYEMRKKESGLIESILKSIKKPGHTDAVLAVDEKGNVAAVVHTCNCVYWGTTGIFVNGVSITDTATFIQGVIKTVGPGARVPKTLNPLIIFRNGRPILASSCLGSGLHSTTIQNLVNVLDFGMDPKTAVDSPNFLLPPLVPSESHKQTIAKGEFSEEILDAVRAMGQELKIVSKEEENPFMRGYWIGIKIDPKTGKLQGGVARQFNGYAEGY